MGTGSSKPSAGEELFFVTRLMEAGDCGDQLTAAILSCHPGRVGEDPADVEACVRATAALRKCMASNKALFKGYIRILDEEKRRWRSGEPADQEDESPRRFKWWAGMRTR